MIRLAYTAGTVVRFVSIRTRETLLELSMRDGALITWGYANRDRFTCRLEDSVITIEGEIGDRLGPVLRSEGDVHEYLAGVRVEFQELVDDDAQAKAYMVQR